MYLSRYKTYKAPVIYEINPVTGEILNKFTQPKDWEWEPERDKAHWERYSGKDIIVFKYQNKLVFQEGKKRYELDNNYNCEISSIGWLWHRFKLFKEGTCVYTIIYRDPQTRIWSLIHGLIMDDDWWNWDTPFNDVKKYLDNF